MKIKLPQSNHYVLSLSGGVDSVSLANFLLQGHKSFEVIHFDHKTRLASSYRDLVEQWCLRQRIRFTTHEFSGTPSEVNWANWRKSILTKISGIVLTAHHKDDRIESFLMGRKLHYNVENIYRPFFEVTKAEILRYATRNNLIWMEDPTNTCSDYRRNKIRNELIPLMKECGVCLKNFGDY